MPATRRTLPAAGLALAIGLTFALSACGSDDDTPAGAAVPDTTVAAPTTTPAAPTTTAAPVPTTTAAPAPAPATDVLEITATEYAFAGPDHVAAGPHTLRLVNAGKEVHEIVIARLNDGVTLEQALQADDPSTVVSGLAQAMAAPGATAEIPVVLTPGNWAAVCMLPAPDGQPHAAHGLVSRFTVS
jgi:hypothetical protein